MVPQNTRARSSTSGSSTSNRTRPISRASTTSVNPPITRPIQSHQHANDMSQLAPPQRPYIRPAPFPVDGMAPHMMQQVTNSRHDFVIDPSLGEARNSSRAMSVDHACNMSATGPRPPMDHHSSFDGREDQYPTQFVGEQPQDDALASEMRKKKGPASSVTNDQELRKLFNENHHRDLKEVASQVLAHERGPRSEKTKQIFAMNW